MSMSGIRDAVKTALETISGLRVYDTVPDVVEVPCAWVLPRSGNYHATFSSAVMNHQLEVTLLVRRGAVIAEAQDDIDAYIDPTGAGSLLAALNAITLGAHGSSLLVRGYRDYGALAFGGETYLGCKLDMEVLVG